MEIAARQGAMKSLALFASVFIGGAVAFTSHAEAKARFQQQKMQVPGTILWHATGDLDADQKTDLVISYRRGIGPAAATYLAVFFRGPAGYPARPHLAFKAPSGSAVFDLGNVDQVGGDEIVYLTSTGVYAQTFVGRKAGAVERIARTRPLVGRAEEEDLITWDFVRSLEPGGPVTIIVPRNGPLELLRHDGEEWKTWSRVRIAPLSFYEAASDTPRRSRRGGRPGRAYSYRITTIIPALWFTDQTGDGKVDLVATYEDRVAVYPRLDDGTISTKPIDRRWFRLQTPEEEKRTDVRLTAQIADVNGDGIGDFTATKIGGGITNLSTTNYFFLGKKGGGFSTKPSQTIKDDGFATLVRFIDVDGDGRVEMIQPFSEVSIIAMSRMLMSSELSFDLRIWKQSKQPGMVFEKKPKQAISATLGLDFGMGGALRGAYPMLGSDLDGDGRSDAIVPLGAEDLAVHHGYKDDEEIFEDDPRIKISVVASLQTQLLFPRTGQTDRPDILILYTDLPKLDGHIALFRNVSPK